MNSKCSLMGADSQVSIMPDLVRSESLHTFRILITLGEDGLAIDDSIGLVCGSNIDRWHFQFAGSIWGCYTPFQVHDPAAPNFLSAGCPEKQTEILLQVGRSGPLKAFLNQPDHIIKALQARYRYVIEIRSSLPLERGDTIELIWGDRRFGSPGVRAPAVAMRYFFFPFKYSLLPRYDRDLPFRRGRFDSMPTVRVIGQKAAAFHLTAPALVTTGERFPLRITAVDKYGNLDPNYTGAVRIESAGGDFPARVIQFRDSDHGRKQVNDFYLRQPGWSYISAGAVNLEQTGQSNAVLCSSKAYGPQILWGAMHGHTLDCDGILSARDHYEYARDTASLDFAACASHAEYFNCQEAWDRYLDDAEQAAVEGDFITFYGYEWAGQGHINAYFYNRNETVNIYGRNILKGDHPDDRPEFRIPITRENEFLKTLKNRPGRKLAISHFHSKYNCRLDDDILRLHEIYSMHQENPREQKYRDILGQGYKIGAVCGSDSHRWGFGHLCGDPEAIWNQPKVIDGETGSQSIQKKSGIQAVYAKERCADSIWSGLTGRHTYGTTGARIVLLFDINGHNMGDIMEVPAETVLTIQVRVGGTADLQSVTVVKFNGQSWSEPFTEHNLGRRFCDLVRKDKAAAGSLYYIRVVQVDNETAWSSPIWMV